MHESGAINTVDPLGGSYFVEQLTNEIERDVYQYFEQIDALGGVIASIESGYFQKEIADASARFQGEIERGDRTIVGVNDFEIEEPIEIPILKMDPQGEARHLERLRRTRAERDPEQAESALQALANVCRDPRANSMPYMLDAVNSYCSLGEIMNTMRDVFGEHQEHVVL